MLISDWSSDVCSSDLTGAAVILHVEMQRIRRHQPDAAVQPPENREIPAQRCNVRKAAVVDADGDAVGAGLQGVRYIEAETGIASFVAADLAPVDPQLGRQRGPNEFPKIPAIGRLSRTRSIHLRPGGAPHNTPA